MVSVTGFVADEGSTSAMGASRSAASAGTPISASVCGMPIRARSSSIHRSTRVEARVPEPEIAPEGRHPVLDGRTVELQHIGHHHRVGEPVVRVVDGAARMAHRVHRAQSLLERGGSHRGGHLHAGPGGEVRAILASRGEPLLHQPDPFERDPLRQRMEHRRAEGLQVVGEGVHPHRGGDMRGQSHGQLRVGDHRHRQHLRVKDDLLGVIPHVGDHRRASDFGAGAGGGRHGDHR